MRWLAEREAQKWELEAAAAGQDFEWFEAQAAEFGRLGAALGPEGCTGPGLGAR